MKTVHTIASSGLYGAEKWILALMRGMETSCCQSTLVNFADDSNMSAVVSAAQERGLAALDFETGGPFNPRVLLRFARWLKDNQIDIVHGHGYKSDLIGLLAAKLAGCRVVSTPHGWTSGARGKLYFYEKLDRYLFRFMDAVCPLSDGLMDSVRSCVCDEKLHLIYNGVDVEEIKKAVPAFCKEKNDFIIGYVGRLVGGKDLPTLFRAIAQFKKVIADVDDIRLRVIIVGDGEDLHLLKTLTCQLELDGNVEFMGFRSDAISFLKCFDAFVLPSLSEGIPRCLMEAMAANIIVVASDIPGNRTLIEDGETGFIFKTGEYMDLFLMLERIIKNKDICYNMRLNAARKIDDIFSNKIMASDYEKLYLKLMSCT